MSIIDLKMAQNLLTHDEVVAIPTETVYGLAGLIGSDIALKKIFITKERPFFDPLIVHVHCLEQAKSLCEHWSTSAEILAKNFWPGPLTLVLPKNKNLVSDLITSGLPTVGLRMPAHPLTLELLQSLPSPLAAPSANKFKQTSPSEAAHVLKGLPGVPVIDGGPCQVGLESTIVQIISENKSQSEVTLQILRPGMIGQQQIKEALNQNFKSIIFEYESVMNTMAPGMMKDHYCPKLPLILCFSSLTQNQSSIEAELRRAGIYPGHILILPSDAFMAARNLYHHLHLSTPLNTGAIIFDTTNIDWNSSAWEPMRDRLTKAASYFIIDNKLQPKT